MLKFSHCLTGSILVYILLGAYLALSACETVDTTNDLDIESDQQQSLQTQTQTQIDSSDTAAVNTESVLCNYEYNQYNAADSIEAISTVQWACQQAQRIVSANGIPDHEVGAFPNANNPNAISAQSVAATMPLQPEASEVSQTLSPGKATGYVLNGVKIDANTAGSCDDSGTQCSLKGNQGNWHIEALGQSSFDFGTDANNAHVQPGGSYHYHGIPEDYIKNQLGQQQRMLLIGWAADGFPIYARYGYQQAMQADSGIKVISGSYQLVTTVSSQRPSTAEYALGTFAQDWQYVAGSGDLDECNGRFGVTPEFTEGIYHYYATDSYPYFQRCIKGKLE